MFSQRLCVFAANLALLVFSTAAGAARIAIDVGHYHKKPGAISARGVAEFNYNLRLAKDIETALKREGHSTMLIGDDGRSENLGSRAPHYGTQGTAGMSFHSSLTIRSHSTPTLGASTKRQAIFS